MEIQILHNQGQSIRQIAQQTGHSRNTVRRYLREQGRSVYGPRPARGSKLDPFKDYIGQRIEFARPHRLPASVLFQEIREQGFVGGERIVRHYVSAQYQQGAPEPVMRFETEPGQQMQVDWCVFQKREPRLSAFVATLGYSRLSYVEFVDNERFDVLRHCHEQAFAYFQGVPKDVLYDNMRTVITKRDAYGDGQHQFHRGLWDMAKHFGFTPRVCRPYRAQTKGKVERFNRYLRYSFYYPLVSRLRQVQLPLDVHTANTEVHKWLRDIANQRVHATLKCRPLSLWEHERPALQALPARLSVQTPEQSHDDDLIARPMWPAQSIQRSPLEYERLLREGQL
jgi:transposase